MLAQEGKAADGTRQEFKLLVRINLFVLWLMDYGAVTVNEEYFFHVLWFR